MNVFVNLETASKQTLRDIISSQLAEILRLTDHEMTCPNVDSKPALRTVVRANQGILSGILLGMNVVNKRNSLF